MGVSKTLFLKLLSIQEFMKVFMFRLGETNICVYVSICKSFFNYLIVCFYVSTSSSEGTSIVYMYL